MTQDHKTANGISRRAALKLGAAGAGALAAFGAIPVRAKDAPIRVLLAPEPKIVPGQLRAGGSANVASCIYDWLFRLEGEDQKFTPSLAERAEHDGEFKTWTIALRPGVFFHNGTELSADDLIFTMNRHSDAAIGSPLKAVFTQIRTMEKVDKLTVRFALGQPDPDFLLKFLDKNAAILVHDYDYAGQGDAKPCGTGPFMVEEYVPSQYMRLKKNPRYFVAGLPKSDALEILFVSDPQTQMLSLEAGQGDIVRTLPFDLVAKYQKQAAISVQRLACGYFTPITMRCDQKPFDDVRVRRAMKLVVDRKQMLDNAAMGYGELANDDYVWPGFPYHAKLPVKPQDIAQAKRLLAEAGYPNGIDVEIVCESNRPPVRDVVLLYQQMAQAAGIRVKVKAVSSDIFYAQYFMKATVVCESWGHREALDLLAVSVRTGATWNEGHYSNPELDRLIEEATAEGGLEKRRALFGRIQTILSEDGPAVIPFFHNVFAASRADVKGFLLTQNWINDYRFVTRG